MLGITRMSKLIEARETIEGLEDTNRSLARQTTTLKNQVEFWKARAGIAADIAMSVAYLEAVFDARFNEILPGDLISPDGERLVDDLPETKRDLQDLDEGWFIYTTDSGLAKVRVQPSTGKVIVTDPNGFISEIIEVTIDTAGELDSDEQRKIKFFLGSVYAAKNAGLSLVSGSVGVVNRRARTTRTVAVMS